MKTAFVALSEKHEGYAFPVWWLGIYPATFDTKELAENGLSDDEWVEEVQILPNGALKRSNGEIFTHNSNGQPFIK